ncbi:MAG: hypothetical protein E6Q34_01485 [Burkholderiaceae bacterium]|nr:MAG: hypothetical protein E6Q34_01485 [Burkholderiaceae bacterium]
MSKKTVAFLAFAALSSMGWATPTPPQTTNLFICDTENGKQYATSTEQHAGRCYKAPDMPSHWHPLFVPKDNKTVIYLDIDHVKWKERVAEIAFVILQVDSSKAVLKDASSVSEFDVLTRTYLHCDSSQQQAYGVELYRNFRTNPELIKRFESTNRPLTPIGSNQTAASMAFALVCSGEYQKLPAYKTTPK